MATWITTSIVDATSQTLARTVLQNNRGVLVLLSRKARNFRTMATIRAVHQKGLGSHGLLSAQNLSSPKTHIAFTNHFNKKQNAVSFKKF